MFSSNGVIIVDELKIYGDLLGPIGPGPWGNYPAYLSLSTLAIIPIGI